MDKETRDLLRAAVDQASRARAARGVFNCDPESLTERANQAEADGLPEVAVAFRNFRDNVVNRLMGEGWTIERIEETVMRVGQKGGFAA